MKVGKVFFGQVMSPHHSYHLSQLVSDETTYRAVPLFSEGQLKTLNFSVSILDQKRDVYSIYIKVSIGAGIIQSAK